MATRIENFREICMVYNNKPHAEQTWQTKWEIERMEYPCQFYFFDKNVCIFFAIS